MGSAASLTTSLRGITQTQRPPPTHTVPYLIR